MTDMNIALFMSKQDAKKLGVNQKVEKIDDKLEAARIKREEDKANGIVKKRQNDIDDLKGLVLSSFDSSETKSKFGNIDSKADSKADKKINIPRFDSKPKPKPEEKQDFPEMEGIRKKSGNKSVGEWGSTSHMVYSGSNITAMTNTIRKINNDAKKSSRADETYNEWPQKWINEDEFIEEDDDYGRGFDDGYENYGHNGYRDDGYDENYGGDCDENYGDDDDYYWK